MKKLIQFILGLILALVIIYLILISLPKAKIDNVAVDYSITAVDLYSQFLRNEEKANTTYLGKIVEVKGQIQMVEEDQAGATVLVLKGDDGFGGVMCTLAESPRSNLYEINQNVTVKGLCAGKLMDVVLNKCIVVNE